MERCGVGCGVGARICVCSVDVCVCIFACMCVSVCGGQRLIWGVFDHSPSNILRQGLSSKARACKFG